MLRHGSGSLDFYAEAEKVDIEIFLLAYIQCAVFNINTLLHFYDPRVNGVNNFFFN
jgi:hypothetical protein